MGYFSSLINTNEKVEIISTNWIEWDHYMIPNKPEWWRNLMRKIESLWGHCLKCTALDGCYFVANNTPEYPLHPNCDCKKLTIPYNIVKTKATAISNIDKFRNYVFAPEYYGLGKVALFKNWGYTINDSDDLNTTYEKQALLAYKSGNYKLKTLDEHGQRLAIPITLKNKTFYSGWMLHPEGVITLSTPFGGWIK